MRIKTAALLGAFALGLTGCITDKMTLTNDQGQTQTCEFTGHVGVISPIVLHERFKHCVDKAKADGYKESTPAKPLV
ncbi:MAG: hypothetical protein WBF89_02510 [Steroidobacteraceae bacterium]